MGLSFPALGRFAWRNYQAQEAGLGARLFQNVVEFTLERLEVEVGNVRVGNQDVGG